MLQSSKVRLGLLIVLKRRILILADLLHRGDLAQKSLGIRRHEQVRSSIEASVLELGKSNLADLQLQLFRHLRSGLGRRPALTSVAPYCP